MDIAHIFHAILHIDQSLKLLVGEYGVAFYLILFVVIFCETGLLPLFFLPGDPLLFVCGAFCASGALDLWLLMPTLFVATFGGCMLNYAIGRYIGAKAYTHNYRWLDRNALNRTHAFCEKYGGRTLLISPYIAVIRTFAPFVAGVSAMRIDKFAWANFGGAALWVVGLVVGGYLFGNIAVIRDHLNALVLAGAAIGLGALLLGTVLRLLRK
ncbi:MAG TPA: VTT domain-containing protein [Burkholderiaceae bacterium]|jgi:membrane-associated protein